MGVNAGLWLLALLMIGSILMTFGVLFYIDFMKPDKRFERLKMRRERLRLSVQRWTDELEDVERKIQRDEERAKRGGYVQA